VNPNAARIGSATIEDMNTPHRISTDTTRKRTPPSTQRPPTTVQSADANTSAAPRPVPAPPLLPGPAILITRRAADRLRTGHLWVYATDVERRIPATGDTELAPGSLATIADSRGIALGTGLYSNASQIAVRLVSRTAQLSRPQYLADVAARLQAALALRAAIAPLAPATSREVLGTASRAASNSATDPAEINVSQSEPASAAASRPAPTDAQRLVFAEADNLPGIVIDRYAHLIILQLLTQGTAQPDVRDVLVAALTKAFADVPGLTILERPDPRIRQLEHLPAPETAALYPLQSAAPPQTARTHAEDHAIGSTADQAIDLDPAHTAIFTLNGLRFHYDASAGQKTGAFLDQRLNYAAAAHHAHGRALDICTYQGGFALHLAQSCTSVTGVDQSRAALEVADRNLALNPQLVATVDWIEADAFELLRAFHQQGERFDTIVLDPPAFAKSQRAVDGAMRGYKEMNLRALQMLAPGGTLVTCSCSHHVSLAEFTAVVAAAASDAGRRVQLLETRAAAPDHPEVLTLPETRYLKCLICRVD
jgi:23S rRNA (cytosine1962-C5)-methyltransferase